MPLISFPQGIAAKQVGHTFILFISDPVSRPWTRCSIRNTLPTAYFRDNILRSESVSASRRASVN